MEPLAWKIVDLDGKVKAYLKTYVDDLIVVGPTEEVRSVLHEVETIWECSGSQILEKAGQELKFCGIGSHLAGPSVADWGIGFNM